MTGTAATTQRLSMAGYAACVWAVLFAAVSFYWAAGGTIGVETNAPAITRPVLDREPGAIAMMWATGLLKIVAGALALALVRPWGRTAPRWLLLTAGWGAAAVMGLYEGLASLVQHALMVADVIDTPSGLGERSARWHLGLWDPWWLVGGVLFALATLSYQRSVAGEISRRTIRRRRHRGLPTRRSR
ncbi:MAG: DUF3995 domain-containing protein [Acidimicrobiales bacterium]